VLPCAIAFANLKYIEQKLLSQSHFLELLNKSLLIFIPNILCNAPTKKCSDSFVLTSVGLLLLYFFFSNYGLDKLFFGFLTIQNISIKLFKNNLDPFIINFTVKINNFNHRFT